MTRDFEELEEKLKTKIVKNQPIDFLGLEFRYSGNRFKAYIPASIFKTINNIAINIIINTNVSILFVSSFFTPPTQTSTAHTATHTPRHKHCDDSRRSLRSCKYSTCRA